MFTSDGYKVKTLKRISDTAVEGRFICGDFQKWESAIALLILYPSESCVWRGVGGRGLGVCISLWFITQQCIHNDITVHTLSILISTAVNSVSASIEMTSGKNNTFRVRCTSTGGRVLNMSVTGPDFKSDLSNIQAVGTLMRMGNDSHYWKYNRR